MTYRLTNSIRRPSNAQLLADLRKEAKKTGKKTITIDQYRQQGTYHFHTLTRRFGTWNAALQKAGLTVKKHYNVPIPQLFDNLRRLWATLGRQPYLNDLYPPRSRFSRRPYLRAFGKWSAALKNFVAAQNHPGTTALPRSHSPSGTPSPSGRVGAGSRSRSPALPHSVSWRLRHLVMKHDNFRCRACGASPATNSAITLHVDHIIPSSKGGQSTPANLQTLCSICNIGKSNL